MSPEHAQKEQGLIINVPTTTQIGESLSRFTTSDRARFWSKVDKSDSDACWPWHACRNPRSGYGQFLNGRVKRHGRMVNWPLLAHRLAWILTNGPVPDKQHVLHRCDNPPCCNPSHLFLGSHRDNMHDASVKGRLDVPRRRTRGFKAEVIARYLAGGTTAAALAAEYDIHPLTVHRWIQAATNHADQRHRSGNHRKPAA